MQSNEETVTRSSTLAVVEGNKETVTRSSTLAVVTGVSIATIEVLCLPEQLEPAILAPQETMVMVVLSVRVSVRNCEYATAARLLRATRRVVGRILNESTITCGLFVRNECVNVRSELIRGDQRSSMIGSLQMIVVCR